MECLLGKSEVVCSSPTLTFIFKKKSFFPAHSQKVNIVRILRDWEVIFSASDSQGANL